MAKKVVLQGGGIIVYGQHVVLRRNKAGKWIFPKGHVDPGETTAETARRESEEETGLLVEVVEAVGSAKVKTSDEKQTVEYYILRALGPGPHWEKHRNVDAFLIPPEQVAAHLSMGSLRRLWDDVRGRVEVLVEQSAPGEGALKARSD
jgi:diadenosine hexaphosphate hydrolase (ATP-forming)